MQYLIIVDLSPLSNSTNTFLKSKEIFVNQPFDKKSYGRVIKQCTCQPKNILCRKKGIFELKCMLEKQCYSASDVLKVHAELDGSLCQIGVNQILCQIVNRVATQTQDGKKVLKKKKIILENRFGGIGPGKAMIENQHKILEVPLSQERKKSISLSSFVGPNMINTSTLYRNSVEGKMVRFQYFLEVEVIFGSCGVYTTNNKLQIPLKILSAEDDYRSHEIDK